LEQLRDSTTLARFNQISWHWPGAENCHQAVLDSTSTTWACCQAGMMAIDHITEECTKLYLAPPLMENYKDFLNAQSRRA